MDNRISIDRRGFVALGGATAAGLAISSLTDIRMVSANEKTESGWEPPCLAKPAPIESSKIVDHHEYDIVIVGAGNAGVPAALSALKNGASVCVVEKNAGPFTQGIEASGIRLETSDEAAIQYLINVHMEANGYRPVREVVETWAHRSGEALQYLLDYSKDNDDPIIISESEADPTVYPDSDKKADVFWVGATEGTFSAGMIALADQAEKDGVDFFYSTPAVQLVQGDDGAVTGVICQNEQGEYVQFDATKGVILAAGDYQNDAEMVKWFSPDVQNETPRQMGKTGDTIKMGYWAGGVIEPVGHTKMCHGADSEPMTSEPFLRVNMEGNRFSAEVMPLSLVQSLFRVSGKPTEYVQLFDGAYETKVASWGGKPVSVEKLGTYMEDDPDYNGRSQLFKDDTIEGLAAKLEIDPKVLSATVERYNELCAKGSDEDFGKDAKYMQPLDTPPFYGARCGLRLTAITSGLLTDGNQRVVDAQGKPIKGLYAAGNTAGGFFGATDYPLYTIQGLSIGKAITGGYVAAENAAKGL